ncbi:MAG TPA: efflux RND transporter periplasmic adaptor subunit [Terriglobia bacterium]|nr:efflux RND transporter periplasmic adaptor subunit [Terriglobia bacterium]
MRLSSFNVAAMLFMLTIGIGLGALMFRNTPEMSATADPPPAPAVSVSSPVVVPSPDKAGGPEVKGSDPSQYVAVIFARQSADIVARSEGRLEAVYVNLGDRLKPGDVIARSESRSIAQQVQMEEAVLRSAQAEQRNAEAELKDAESRYRRRDQLWASGLISQEDLASAKVQIERAETRLEVAQARVAEQMARIEETKESLANTVVTAAFAGTVAARYLDSGATVRSGTPIISLIKSEDLWVRFAIPEAQQTAMSIGSLIRFQADGVTVVIPGVIEYVSPALTTISQEFLAEARLRVPAFLLEQIKPGASGIVSLATSATRGL